jgi:hypothetical protein
MARENALRKVEQGLADAIAAAKTGNITQAEVAEMLRVLYGSEEGF